MEKTIALIEENFVQELEDVFSGKLKTLCCSNIGYERCVKLLTGIVEENDDMYEIDPNGCDMDWGFDFEHNGEGFHAWGSLMSGSFLVSKD